VSAAPAPARVVVIDNGSGDDSVDRLAAWASQRDISSELIEAEGALSPERRGEAWLTIVKAPANLGFAGGNNAGLALLRNEPGLTRFLLLNNDAVVAPDFFTQIAAALNSDPGAGLCSGTIYALSNRTRVWYAGGRVLPLRALALHNLRRPSENTPVGTEFITGCAMVISRAALEYVGMLPECYFPGYMEDVEYSLRMRAEGFDLIYAPAATVYHKIGASFGSRVSSTLVAYHTNRHRVFFVRRNLRGPARVTALLYMALTKPGRALIDLLAGRPDIAWATLRGTMAGFVERPSDVKRTSAPGLQRAAARLAGDGAAR